MTTAAAALLLLFLLSAAVPSRPEPVAADKAALLSFITRLPHAPRIVWNPTTPACSWTGVTCDSTNTSILYLRLPGAELAGPIPGNTLTLLSSLRVLSLHSNALSGPIPPSLSNLTLLRSLYLHSNRLSGDIPPSLSSLVRLARLDLSSNNLTGGIPFAFSNLSRLTGLFLENNGLSGSIPSISIPGLTELNVSHNALNGSVPASLARFPASSFAGNLNLCGSPLPSCAPFFPAPAPAAPPAAIIQPSNHNKLSTAAIVGIAAGAVLLAALLLFMLLFLCLRRRRQRGKGPPPAGMKTETTGETGMSSSSMSKETAAERGGGGGDGGNRLVFVGKGGGYSFDLEDLLRASAEVLGKGTLGTSYKAVLEEGTTVVVKRLKDVIAIRREFEQHMDGLGRPEVQDHPNILPLRAYYFSKDEKLLVFDYLAAGSLSSMLHGSRGSGRTPLDWESRMRVALAVGRGLAHLHGSAGVVHGDIKSSNVLLRHDPELSALSDYGLNPLFGPGPAQRGTARIAGYRAPEVVETRRPTYKSDVYSLGVLLLELLTGKAPNQASIAGEEGIDLPRWVQSVVREEWTAEVFDVELMRYPNIEEEMVQLLQIAMACVAVVPDSRPDAPVVVKMMEDIVRRVEPGDDGQPGSSEPSKSGGTPPAGTTP